MSQKIYFEKNGKQIGPIELSDLKLNELKPETLIWFQGLSSWKMVKDVPEIRDLLITIPPPLPSQKQLILEEKYDLTYPKEEGLTALGFLLFVAPFFLKFIGFLEFPKEEDFYFKLMIIIVSLSCRIGVTFAVISTAKRLMYNPMMLTTNPAIVTTPR